MRDSPKVRFVQILRMELEAIERHIDGLVHRYERSRDRCELSEHVCCGNLAVLRSERFGIEGFFRIIDALEPDAYENMDALVADVKKRFREYVHRSNLAPAIYLFAERKIDRMRSYVDDHTDRPCLEPAPPAAWSMTH